MFLQKLGENNCDKGQKFEVPNLRNDRPKIGENVLILSSQDSLNRHDPMNWTIF